MKRSMLSVLLGAAAVLQVNTAQATLINLGVSSAAGSLAQFDGNDPGVGLTGSFTLLNNGAGSNILLVGSDGTGDSFGLQGTISGTFSIGPITVSGPVESAPVTGPGSFAIADGSGGFLTGAIDWVDILTIGNVGGLNTSATVNLSSINYSGNTIQDFIDFASEGDGIAALSFQFAVSRSLTQLTQNGVTTNALSYSGTLSNVPEPGAILILSMLSAGLLVRRR